MCKRERQRKDRGKHCIRDCMEIQGLGFPADDVNEARVKMAIQSLIIVAQEQFTYQNDRIENTYPFHAQILMYDVISDFES